MKDNRKQVSIDGQAAMLALKYLYQFTDPRTYKDLIKQVILESKFRLKGGKDLARDLHGITKITIDHMMTVNV